MAEKETIPTVRVRDADGNEHDMAQDYWASEQDRLKEEGWEEVGEDEGEGKVTRNLRSPTTLKDEDAGEGVGEDQEGVAPDEPGEHTDIEEEDEDEDEEEGN